MERACVKCSSRKIIPSARVLGGSQSSGADLKAEVAKKPKAVFFRGSVITRIRARICGECGYAELFADEPAIFYEAYLATKS